MARQPAPLIFASSSWALVQGEDAGVMLDAAHCRVPRPCCYFEKSQQLAQQIMGRVFEDLQPLLPTGAAQMVADQSSTYAQNQLSAFERPSDAVTELRVVISSRPGVPVRPQAIKRLEQGPVTPRCL